MCAVCSFRSWKAAVRWTVYEAVRWVSEPDSLESQSWWLPLGLASLPKDPWGTLQRTTCVDPRKYGWTDSSSQTSMFFHNFVCNKWERVYVFIKQHLLRISQKCHTGRLSCLCLYFLHCCLLLLLLPHPIHCHNYHFSHCFHHLISIRVIVIIIIIIYFLD